MQLNHPRTTPYPQSMEVLSWTKPVPGAEKVGDCCFTVLSEIIHSQRQQLLLLLILFSFISRIHLQRKLAYSLCLRELLLNIMSLQLRAEYFKKIADFP